MNIPLLPVLLYFLVISRLIMGCPPSCTCKWRNGKQAVECVNRGLTTLPETIEPTTQVLDILGNNFPYLQAEMFLAMSLVNLQKIYLTRCNIKIIENDAFIGLTNLVELDLSENNLEAVPTDALLNCPSLMKLSLSKNPIFLLNRLAFNHLSFLTNLDLSGCEIITVHEAAFNGLYSLEWIDLSQNQLKFLPDMGMFPNTLKGVQLQDNPWTCDCHIRTFNSWLKRNIVPILIPPICEKPQKFKGFPVSELDETELACAPEVSPNSFYFELEEEKNLTLLCQVKSIPAANISWLFKGQVLQNNSQLAPGLHLVYFIEEGTEEKRSNLFIYNLNSEDNGTFYCQAENQAGVSYANYTIMIILKRRPIAIEEKMEFPIEIASIILAAGLILLCLCFVALIMSLIRCFAKRKPQHSHLKTKDKLIESTKSEIPQKSNLKPTDKRTSIFQTNLSNQDGTLDEFHQVQEQNPDIINGIGSNEILNPAQTLAKPKVQNIPHVLDMSAGINAAAMGRKDLLLVPDSAVAPGSLTRQRTQPPGSLTRQRTQPYFKPTLTSRHRPVSAPTFERFVENCDVRYTADGYPVRRDINQPIYNLNLYNLSIPTGSFSAVSTPKQIPKNLAARVNKVVEKTLKSNKETIVLNPGDVQL